MNMRTNKKYVKKRLTTLDNSHLDRLQLRISKHLYVSLKAGYMWISRVSFSLHSYITRFEIQEDLT